MLLCMHLLGRQFARIELRREEVVEWSKWNVGTNDAQNDRLRAFRVPSTIHWNTWKLYFMYYNIVSLIYVHRTVL